jgi:hypothetical protein
MLHTSPCRQEERRVDQERQSRLRPTRRHVLWAGVIAALAFLIIVICGYLFGWKWTGLPNRTLWDWLDLLIVPIVLAIGGYLFTRCENRATQAAAERRAQDDTLQAYLDGMSQLLTDKELALHSAQPGDSLSTVARARTLTVLSRLDGGRKGSVLEFLYESRLIDREQAFLDESDRIEKRHNIISLEQADLSGANLSGAYLTRAKLRVANLSWAYVIGAHVSEVRSLEGATMPDGQKYEDWLKSKAAGMMGRTAALRNGSRRTS